MQDRNFAKKVSFVLDGTTHVITTLTFLFCGFLLDAQIGINPLTHADRTHFETFHPDQT